MGAHHSSDKSVPRFDYENKHHFPYNQKCPIESNQMQILPKDLSCINVSIPCAGACPNIQLMQLSFISGLPNPRIFSYLPESYKVAGIDSSQYSLPLFDPSGQYSFIRLTSKFTKDDLVNTSQVEASLSRVFFLYQDEIDPGTFPSFNDAPSGLASFSAPYQRLHVLACRLIYHQIMCQNKILYFGSPEPLILTIEGEEFALIHHPSFFSSLFSTSKSKSSLFPFYPSKFLYSLNIASYELRLSPLDLVRSAFSFLRDPTLPLIRKGDEHFLPGTTRVTMPFALLYLDCLSDQSIHTLHSFIFHHILAGNTGSTVYNPDAPIIVVLINSTLLDRGLLIDENTILEVFEKHLSITPQIYLAPLCPSQEIQSYQFFNTSTPEFSLTHYFNTPSDASSPIPTAQKSQVAVSFSNEDFKRSCDEWLQVLNTALLQEITPLFLRSLASKSKPTLSYAYSIPLCNPSNFCSILPFAQATDPSLIQQFQWHNLQKSGVQVIQLSIFTFYINDDFPVLKMFSSNSTHHKVPFIKAMCSTDLSNREVNIGAEYLADIQNLLECPVNSYTPIQLITNDISHILDTTLLQNSSSHVKMFAPLEYRLDQTQISEQTILDQLDEDYRYSLISSPIINGTVFGGGGATSDSCLKKNENNSCSASITRSIDSGVDICHESDMDSDNDPNGDNFTADDYGTCHSQHSQNNENENADSLVLIESRDKVRSYTFHYRGEHNSRLNKQYTARINYFTSSQNTNIEIKITSPDFCEPTHANRTTSLPIPLPYDVSTAYCALPMNQVLAIDTHLSNINMTPQVKKQPYRPRYLVQLTNHLRQDRQFNMTPHFHPYMCPAICILLSYNSKVPYFTSHQKDHFNYSRDSLLNLNINIPLFLIFAFPDDFNIQFDKLPLISKFTQPLYGWDSDCIPYVVKKLNQTEIDDSKNKKKDQGDDTKDNITVDNIYGGTQHIASKEPHSQDDIEFHCHVILQRMKHIARYLTEPPPSHLDSSQFTQRTVYYFIVKGAAGYFECLPRVNLCALAHFFSLGIQPSMQPQ